MFFSICVDWDRKCVRYEAPLVTERYLCWTILFWFDLHTEDHTYHTDLTRFYMFCSFLVRNLRFFFLCRCFHPDPFQLQCVINWATRRFHIVTDVQHLISMLNEYIKHIYHIDYYQNHHFIAFFSINFVYSFNVVDYCSICVILFYVIFLLFHSFVNPTDFMCFLQQSNTCNRFENQFTGKRHSF